VHRIDRDAMAALLAYPWPGNVRELVNVVERAVSFCDGDVIALGDLPDYVRDAKSQIPSESGSLGSPPPPITSAASYEAPRPPETLMADGVTFKDAKERWVSSFERDYILSLLKRHSGNISHAARDADIDRKYFRKLMKKYEIEAAGVDLED
jgi:DNA-binding NtrC family response regulator